MNRNRTGTETDDNRRLNQNGITGIRAGYGSSFRRTRTGGFRTVATFKHAGILSMKQPTPHCRPACTSAIPTAPVSPHEYHSAQSGWGDYSHALTDPHPKHDFHNTSPKNEQCRHMANVVDSGGAELQS